MIILYLLGEQYFLLWNVLCKIQIDAVEIFCFSLDTIPFLFLYDSALSGGLLGLGIGIMVFSFQLPGYCSDSHIS